MKWSPLRLSDKVILRLQPKNLKILRPAQADNSSLCGACPERLDLSSSTGLAEGLRMTLGIFSVGSSYTATNWVKL